MDRMPFFFERLTLLTLAVLLVVLYLGIATGVIVQKYRCRKRRTDQKGDGRVGILPCFS